ncbi:hypothetical protein CUMW_014370, partial [Citrus unshiu]
MQRLTNEKRELCDRRSISKDRIRPLSSFHVSAILDRRANEPFQTTGILDLSHAPSRPLQHAPLSLASLPSTTTPALTTLARAASTSSISKQRMHPIPIFLQNHRKSQRQEKWSRQSRIELMFSLSFGFHVAVDLHITKRCFVELSNVSNLRCFHKQLQLHPMKLAEVAGAVIFT